MLLQNLKILDYSNEFFISYNNKFEIVYTNQSLLNHINDFYNNQDNLFYKNLLSELIKYNNINDKNNSFDILILDNSYHVEINNIFLDEDSYLLLKIRLLKQTEEQEQSILQKLKIFDEQNIFGYFVMLIDEPIEWSDQVDKDKTIDYVFAHQRVTHINDEMLNQYKAKREDFLGLTPSDFFAHDIDYGKKVWKDFFDKGKLLIDTDERRFDGSQMWIEGHYICLYDDFGRIIGHYGIQKDVTEKKYAEKIINEQRQTFLDLFEKSLAGYWDWNIETNEEFLSPRFKKEFGFEDNELPNEPSSWLNLIVEEDKPKLYKMLDAHINSKGETPFHIELRYNHKNGNIVNILCIVKWENDKPLRMIGCHINIDEQKKFQNSLAVSEQTFRELFNNLNEPILILDYNNIIIDVNSTFYKEFEFAPTTIIGQSFEVIISPDNNLTDIYSILNESRNQYIPKTIQIECIYHNSKTKSFLLSLQPINYYNNKVIAALLIDIHHILKLTKELKKSESKFKLLSDSSYDWIYWINENNNEIYYSSPSSLRLTGYEVNEFFDNPELIKEIIHPDDLQIYLEHLKDNFYSENDELLKFRIITKDGKIKWVSHICSPIIDKNNDFSGRKVILRDITDVVETNIRNEILIENFEKFFNLTSDFLFVLDFDGNIIKTNHAVIDKLGYSNEELINNSVLNIHPETRREEAANIVKSMLEGKFDRCPIPLLRKDGSQIPVETRVTKGVWDNKPAIFGISRDVSEIVLSEEKFRKIFEHHPSAMALSSIETRLFIDVNKAFLEITKYSREEVINKRAIDLNIFKNSDDRIKALELIQKNGNLRDFEVTILNKFNEEFIGLFSAEMFYIGSEKVLLTIMIDITKLKKVENELKESQNKLQAIFDGTSEAILVVEQDSKNIIFANQSSANLFKYNANELINKSILEIYSSDYVAHINDLFNETNLGIKKTINNMPIILKNGKTIYCDIKNAIVLFDNKKCCLAFYTDVTEKRLSEIEKEKLMNELIKSKENLEILLYQKESLNIELQRQKDELNYALSERDKVFSVIAHDLRAPFNGFIGLTQVMKDELFSMSLEEINKFSAIIHNSAENLLYLLENLLEWSRIKRDKIEINQTIINIKEEISRVILTLDSLIIKKEIQIVNNIKNEHYINVDINMFYSIIRNLISNAIKYSYRKGIIELNSKMINGLIEISIIDYGIGIEGKIIPTLISAKHKESKKGTEGESSSGLGLSIVYDYVIRNNGNLNIESELGKFTKVIISFPSV